MTPAVKKLIQQRQVAFHLNNLFILKRLRNKVKMAIRIAKHNYYNKRVRSLKASNSAAWYRQIKLLTNGQREEKPISVPGVDQNNTFGIANSINDHFASVVPTKMSDIGMCTMNSNTVIKLTKCRGPDNIPARIIREFACELTTPLTHIFNTSLELCIVPDVWKRAVIVPIPKCSPAVVNKLRPIALTDHFAKVLEGFVAKWTVEDLKPCMDHKKGNRKGLSTTHYLIDLLHTLYKHAETRKATSTLVLTIEKGPEGVRTSRLQRNDVRRRQLLAVETNSTTQWTNLK